MLISKMVHKGHYLTVYTKNNILYIAFSSLLQEVIFRSVIQIVTPQTASQKFLRYIPYLDKILPMDIQKVGTQSLYIK